MFELTTSKPHLMCNTIPRQSPSDRSSPLLSRAEYMYASVDLIVCRHPFVHLIKRHCPLLPYHRTYVLLTLVTVAGS